MKALLVVIACLAASCGRGEPGTSSSYSGLSQPPAIDVPRVQPGDIRLRVMTYNVNFGGAGDPAGLAAIASASPDLVFLQETTDGWATALVERFGTSHPHHRFAPAKNEWIAGGMGVLSKWPITKLEQLDSDAGPFFAWRAIVDAPGGPLQVLNVHLRPPMSESGSWIVGFFAARAVREREMRDHLKSIDPALPTIALGDFNEEDEGMAIALLLARGFVNALPRFHPDVDTWQWPVGGTTLRFRLDHILYSRHFDALDANVVAAGRSDHAPVWADLVRR
jgi:endonuclease/exonuclease/phosphatase family metal-dependent hydrolase